MRVGTAKFARECSACGKLIKTGEPIAQQRMVGQYSWVHRDCYRPGGIDRDIKRLDKEFAAITRKPILRGAARRAIKPVESGCRWYSDCFTCPFDDCVAVDGEFPLGGKGGRRALPLTSKVTG